MNVTCIAAKRQHVMEFLTVSARLHLLFSHTDIPLSLLPDGRLQSRILRITVIIFHNHFISEFSEMPISLLLNASFNICLENVYLSRLWVMVRICKQLVPPLSNKKNCFQINLQESFVPLATLLWHPGNLCMLKV